MRAGGHCPCHKRARQMPSLSPRAHQSPRALSCTVIVPGSPGWKSRRVGRRGPPCAPFFRAVDARRRAFGGECHSARVTGRHAGPHRGCGSCTRPSRRAQALMWGRGGRSDGTGCEPLALSIPGCARRSACARGAPRTRSCAEPTSRRSTARCWAVSGTTPPTAAGTWAPGEPAPRVSVPRVGGGAPFARGPASSVAAARAVSRTRPSGPFTLRRAACPVAGVSCARFSLHGVPVLVLPDWAQLSRGAPRPPAVVGGPAEPSRRPQISVWEKRSRRLVPRGPPGRPSAERWGLLCAALLFSAGPTGPQEHSVAAGGRAREAPPARVRSARLSAVVPGAPLETH